MMSGPDETNIEYRDAHQDDVPMLLEFLTPFFESRQIIKRSATELSTLVKHGFLAYVRDEAEERGTSSGSRIIGFGAIEVYSQKLAEIQSLAVDKEFQGQGIGHALVQQCVARARQERVLELMAITASEKLFRDVGFDYALPNQKRAFFLQTRDE